MSNQKPRTIEEQMLRLKSLGMEFNDESLAKSYLSRISYFRLKYFWPDLIDNTSGDFKDGTYFEDIIERYEFDKSLRGILFNARVAFSSFTLFHENFNTKTTLFYKKLQQLCSSLTISRKG